MAPTMNAELLPAKSLVKADLERDGVSIAVRNGRGGVLSFGRTVAQYQDETKPQAETAATPLYLREDEALGRYFGGDAVSNDRLRQDYDAERGRVDKLIGHLIGVRSV